MTKKPANSVEKSVGITELRLVTREMLHLRTLELAEAAGRPAPHVSQADYEQAKRELMGVADDERDAIIASGSDPETEISVEDSLYPSRARA